MRVDDIHIEFLSLATLNKNQVQEISQKFFNIIFILKPIKICIENFLQHSSNHLYLENPPVRDKSKFVGNQSNKSHIYFIIMHYFFYPNTIDNKKCSLIEEFSQFFYILLFHIFASFCKLELSLFIFFKSYVCKYCIRQFFFPGEDSLRS